MNTKLIISMLIAASMALTFTPGVHADPCNDVDGSPTVNWGDNCEESFATGPGVVVEQGVVLVGAGVCFTNSSFPAACDPTPGAIAGAGAAFFDTTGWPQQGNGADSIARVDVWAEWQNGVWGDAAIPDSGGFMISVCNDRDNNDVCTNLDEDDGDQGHAPKDTRPHSHGTNAQGYDDQLWDGYSRGEDADKNPGCGDHGKKKDDKTCSPMDVGLQDLCIVHDVDGGFDDVVVFIGNYHGSSQFNGEEDKVGISSGTYLVTMELMTDSMGNDDFDSGDLNDPVDHRATDAGCGTGGKSNDKV